MYQWHVSFMRARECADLRHTHVGPVHITIMSFFFRVLHTIFSPFAGACLCPLCQIYDLKLAYRHAFVNAHAHMREFVCAYSRACEHNVCEQLAQKKIRLY